MQATPAGPWHAINVRKERTGRQAGEGILVFISIYRLLRPELYTSGNAWEGGNIFQFLQRSAFQHSKSLEVALSPSSVVSAFLPACPAQILC